MSKTLADLIDYHDSTAVLCERLSQGRDADAELVNAHRATAHYLRRLQTIDENLLPGLMAITRERFRQIDEEGFDREHDDSHARGELARAAAAYALPDTLRAYSVPRPEDLCDLVEIVWPWAEHWWRPSPDDRLRELVKAGALILAEIERLGRAEVDQ